MATAPLIRPFRPEDAAGTRAVFVDAVRVGAAGRYTEAERLAWVPDPALRDDWGPWLARHITLVAERAGRIDGFMMLERSGYVNLTYVRAACMGTGLADALYAAILSEARALGLTGLTVLASRYAQGFFARHGWQLAPDLTGLPGMDPDQRPGANPMNRPMRLSPVPAP